MLMDSVATDCLVIMKPEIVTYKLNTDLHIHVLMCECLQLRLRVASGC